jgi:hypothetical protein
MADPDHLRVAAIDEEDLAVVSAYAQDSVLKVGDMIYLPAEHRFALAMNRFIWERAIDGKRPDYERRRAALTFDRVLKVQTIGIDRDRPDTVLELLAVSFAFTDNPAGIVELIFAGGGAVRLSVEVIEARLADIGAAWATHAKPSHETNAGA